jgi:putative oxidoreductase
MHRLYGPFVGGRGAVGLLVLRLVAGMAFMLHGWSKIQDPFGWMGPSMPGFLQALAALAEFGGGLAWILGLLTPIASFGILCTMLVAAGMVHIPKGDPFVGKGGPSWELAAVYFSVALLLLLLGPGRFALDYLLFGRPRGAAEGESR